MSPCAQKAVRRELGVERVMLRGPSYINSLCARVRGQITPTAFRQAVQRLRRKHLLLGVRISEDERGFPWFVSDDVPEIPVRTIIRQDDCHWQRVIISENRIGFDVETGPLARFTLLRSAGEEPVSDIVICCQHSSCDGLSVCYLIHDLLSCLSNPEHPMEAYPLPPSYSAATIPGVTPKYVIFGLLASVMNGLWRRKGIRFSKKDHSDLFSVFREQPLSVSSWEISGPAAEGFFARCKAEGVTVNSGVCAALLASQCEVQGEREGYLRSCLIPVNIRDRLRTPIGRELGFYSTGIAFGFESIGDMALWDLARCFNRKIKLRLRDNRFIKTLLLTHLDPALLDALLFTQYKQFDDPLVSRILKLLKWDRLAAGFEISNLGRLDFLAHDYGPLSLSAIFGPAICMPLAEKFVGITTCGTTMTLTFTSSDTVIPPQTVRDIGQATMAKIESATQA